MMVAVDKIDGHVHQRKACQRAVLQRRLQARVDRVDVLARDGAAANAVVEDVSLARLGRSQIDDHHRVLARTAGLLDVAVLELVDRRGDCLSVGHLRLADRGVNLEFPQHPVDEHLEMQLAHARDHRLAGLEVGLDLEGGIFLAESCERPAQLVLVALGLGLDSDVHDWIGEAELLEHDRLRRIAQRVASAGVLQTDACDDVAGCDVVTVPRDCWRASAGCARCARDCPSWC